MDFGAYLQAEKKATQKAVADFFQHKRKYYQEIDPTFSDYLAQLELYSLRGGKWHRPTLTRLTYQSLKGETDRKSLLKASAGVELLHRFLLVHDDIFDGDLQRHGGPTLEAVFAEEQSQRQPPYPVSKYDLGMAMIGGDILHTFALELVREAQLPSAVTLATIRGFHECMAVTAAGWRLETILKQMPLNAVAKTQVEKAMWLVSGQYSILWPLRFGQLIAGTAFGDWDPVLESYGRHIGLAFQIQDDILGLFGATHLTGKPVGHDFREGKKSLILLYTYAKSDADSRTYLDRFLGTETTLKEMSKIQEIILKSGAVTQARAEITKHIQTALKALDSSTSRSSEIDRLRELGAFLGNRDI